MLRIAELREALAEGEALKKKERRGDEGRYPALGSSDKLAGL
jgi:hypothetical protein